MTDPCPSHITDSSIQDEREVLRLARRSRQAAYNAEYYKKNKERASVSGKARYEKNKEKIKAAERARRLSDPEKYKAAAAKSRARDRDKNLKRGAAYRESHRKELSVASRIYAKSNKERTLLYQRNYKAKKRSAPGKLSVDIVQKLMALQKNKCSCCRRSLLETGKHLDHVIPLSTGGHNSDDNVQLLCPSCNTSKGAKHPVDFMQSRGFLL